MITKITNRFYSRHLPAAIFLCVSAISAAAQDSTFTRPPVTSRYDDYKKQVKKDPSRQMVELKKLIPTLVYDLRYATTHNFMNRLMYPANTQHTFMRKPAADSLLAVQKDLQALGLGLKIFDAYRPYSVTVHFWELVKDERYVANPSKGSGHNRGIAADLTLIRLSSGEELDMGTGFDNFTDSAHHSFTRLPAPVLLNRTLLKNMMEKHGFKAFDTEWWHYFLPNADRFEILDIPFQKLNR